MSKKIILGKKMTSIDMIQEKLKDYNGEQFYEKLSAEIERTGLKKGYFLKRIGKPLNWLIRRKLHPPSPGALLLIEQEFGINILQLIETKRIKKTKSAISYNKNEEILINGQIINLNTIHSKILFILSYEGPEREYLIDTIETCYENIHKKKLKKIRNIS